MNHDHLSRRQFCARIATITAVGTIAQGKLVAVEVPTPASSADSEAKFKPWSWGCFDLHHISTGRGNAMLAICPDGTVMMVDAGAVYDPLKYTITPKPNASRRPGEWIARYVSRHIAATGASVIDHLLITHLHSDHLGGWAPDLPKSTHGDYLLTGVTDVAEQLPIRKLVDRAFPDYAYPPDKSYAAGAQNRLTSENYRRYLAHRSARGESVEQFVVGTTRQFALAHAPEKFPEFNIRNLAANGTVWTGQDEGTTHRFPEIGALPPHDYPTENMCSAAIRLQYGRFSYYTGGDLPNDPVGWFDPPGWRDIATPVAQAAGPVSVAVANHHGYIDSMGADCVRALRPKVFVIFGWDSAHPTIRPLFNMLNCARSEGPRDVFATAIKEENTIATRDLAKLKSQNGHVVVRVPPGGESFTVEILDNADECDRVLARHGPYVC
jgi:hypothetical protein